uniref:Uncharacterized protein n=1 Tax=Peronospora matthiolae TaxID=2874970 RepID=A0AAV1USA2_9STRA
MRRRPDDGQTSYRLCLGGFHQQQDRFRHLRRIMERTQVAVPDSVYSRTEPTSIATTEQEQPLPLAHMLCLTVSTSGGYTTLIASKLRLNHTARTVDTHATNGLDVSGRQTGPESPAGQVQQHRLEDYLAPSEAPRT